MKLLLGRQATNRKEAIDKVFQVTGVDSISEDIIDMFTSITRELVRLGYGKPKFIGDKKGVQMLAIGYPELSIEDWREYSLLGCTEPNLPHIAMGNLYEANSVAAKILQLV